MGRQQMAIERESVGQMEVIRFETPELGSLPKVSSHIAQSDILSVVIQVVGGDECTPTPDRTRSGSFSQGEVLREGWRGRGTGPQGRTVHTEGRTVLV